MRLNTKVALAGIISTTAIGLANMNEPVEAKQQVSTKDTNVVLNKNVHDLNKTNPTCKFVQYPFGGK